MNVNLHDLLEFYQFLSFHRSNFFFFNIRVILQKSVQIFFRCVFKRYVGITIFETAVLSGLLETLTCFYVIYAR